MPRCGYKTESRGPLPDWRTLSNAELRKERERATRMLERLAVPHLITPGFREEYREHWAEWRDHAIEELSRRGRL